MREPLLVVALLLTGGATVSAQDTGFLNRTVRVEGAQYRYQVYVPREFKPSVAWPAILALHGGGQFGDDGVLQTDVGLGHAIRLNPDRFPAVVVFPQIPQGPTPGFQALGGRIALAALDHAVKEFNVDPARIYLTGLSAGGNGSWYLAFHHPERFAAVVVVCGFIGEREGTAERARGKHYPPIISAAVHDPYATIARRISHLPIWIFHGDADTTVPVEESRRMASALKAEGANVQYTELPGVLHNAWDPAYEREDLFAWLFKQRHRR